MKVVKYLECHPVGKSWFCKLISFILKIRKKIPYDIVIERELFKNGSSLDFMQLMEVRKRNKNISFSQQHKITISGLYFLRQTFGLKTSFQMRDRKFNDFGLITVKKEEMEKLKRSIIWVR